MYISSNTRQHSAGSPCNPFSIDEPANSKDVHIHVTINDEDNRSAKQVFNEFCSETTAHGFSHAAREKRWSLTRVMWILVIISAAFLTGVQLFYLFSEYFNIK